MPDNPRNPRHSWFSPVREPSNENQPADDTHPADATQPVTQPVNRAIGAGGGDQADTGTSGSTTDVGDAPSDDASDDAGDDAGDTSGAPVDDETANEATTVIPAVTVDGGQQPAAGHEGDTVPVRPSETGIAAAQTWMSLTDRYERPAGSPADETPTVQFERHDFAAPPAATLAEAAGDSESSPSSAASSDGSRRRRLLRNGGIAAAAALGLLIVLYGLDLVVSQGNVPRGVTVAGVEVGGMDRTAAEEALREQIGPRLEQPVQVRAGEVTGTIDPAAAGLRLDWPATLERAGEQPLNPWTRLTSFFTSRELGVVSQRDGDGLENQLNAMRAETDWPAAEGTVRFEGITPVPVDPRAGQRLDGEGAIQAIEQRWAFGQTVELPVVVEPVTTTPDGVRAAVRDIAEPAVSGPVTITGEGANAVVEPEVIAAALRWAPNGEGGLNATIDQATIVNAARPQLAATENPGHNAHFVIENGAPVVVPSTTGRGVVWEETLAPLLDVVQQGGERSLPARYGDIPAQLTTEEAEGLGIVEPVSSFTTGGFAADSGINIQLVAQEVNGAIVRPGETFSLNGHTGIRNQSTGYVPAGIIMNGVPARGIGGGISQFATTLYNAAYFAGMVDVAHTEHGYYISRYPVGREATVFQNPDGSSVIDLQFRNDTPHGVLITTTFTPTDITVTFWSTKVYDVESITSERYAFTSPPTRVIPYGEPCNPSSGSNGFSVDNTRIIRDAATGAEISRETQTAVYSGQYNIICEPPPEPEPPPDAEAGAPPPPPPPE